MMSTMVLYTNDFGTYFDDHLLQSIKQGKNDAVRSMLRKATDSRNLICSSAATLLHYAAEYGNEEIVQYLVELGSDVNAQNQLKETPLMLALEGSFEKTIDILLAANADVYILDIYGKSVLFRLFNDTELVSDSIICKKFLDKVLNDKRDNEFVAAKLFEANCPLYRVVYLKNAVVTRLLLEKGSEADAREPTTVKTALHIAVEQLDLENVKVLLEHNADINVKDCNGRTPLSLLPSIFKVLEIMKILLSRGSVLLESDCAVIPFHRVFMHGNKQAICTYLQNNLDFYTILKALLHSFLPLCRYLLDLFNPTVLKKIK